MNSLLDLPELKHFSQLSAFVAKIHENTQALEALRIPMNQYDPLLVASLFRKLSQYYRRRFDDWRGVKTDYPKAIEILEFLKKECLAADDSVHAPKTRQEPKPKALITTNSPTSGQPGHKRESFQQNLQCICCNDLHPLYHCSRFRQMSTQDRRTLVQKTGTCFNCLKTDGHRSRQCKNTGRCRNCNSPHHTMLCPSSDGSPIKQIPPKSAECNPDKKEMVYAAGTSTSNTPAPGHPITLTSVADVKDNSPTVLLGSALIRVQGGDGRFHTVRAVIDSAATSSYILTKAAKRIGLCYARSLAPMPVSGIGGSESTSGIQGSTTCVIKPRNVNEPLLATETMVIEKIVTDLPCTRIADRVKSYFSDLNLSDPPFNVVKEVEFLIGADVFPHIFTGAKRFGPTGYPPALESIFGWVITGRVGKVPSPQEKPVTLIAASPTDALLRRFWELEDVPKSSHVHPDDMLADKMFQEKHYRLSDGRYVVPLMLRENAPPLGESKGLALMRLDGTLRRLNKDPKLKAQYSEFLTEYETLNHMTLTEPENYGKAAYYIPHHFVTREDSTTTKLRVVFDASQKTASGTSLNDIVLAGPKLQNEIFDIILRFRTHQKVFTCDISKMYRQILIRPEDRKFQHIFWKHENELREYELNTVSYGVTSAPYCALRVIKQLKEDEGHNFPLAAKVIDKDIFVDDIATGCTDTQGLLELKRQTIGILKSAGCEVQKWASNSPELLSEILPEHRVTSLDLTEGNANTKLLGIHWNAQTDSFYYQANKTPHKISKRTILSNLARIYDPLGLLTPIVFKAKTIMQKLWLQGIGWDNTVPANLSEEWMQFYNKLPAICNLRVERCIVLKNAQSHQLIGFCDASSLGYCAVVFLRSENSLNVKISLLAAKSRVAPTKTVSIPRLELCGAQLLSTLMQHVETELIEEVNIDSVATFTDSQIVLSWLRTIPCQLKTFEANRVSYILDRIQPSSWRFIPSDQNPADIGSRGCFADQLPMHSLWWTGPSWLKDPIAEWPVFTTKSKLNLTLILISTKCDFWEPLISKFSSLIKLQRVTAWILRYTNNKTLPPELRFKDESLTITELERSLAHVIKTIQRKHFAQEIKTLEKLEMPKNLKSLQPFIDPEGIVRVGGRLRHAKLPYHSKHPILLPKHDHFVNLLIDAYHIRYLHAGPRLLQSILARQFWILSARSVIRSILSKCVTCFHARPSNTHQLMGDLPPSRVTPTKPFYHVATDFAGPFMIREHKRRNPKLSKAYLCLIICMATKAVYLDVVSDLSTEAFLAALDRFVSRRGSCKTITSDNATNFTGAKRHLSEVYQFLLANKTRIDDQLATRQIEWHFLPPNAPNFGGVHEAGVKTAKYHLKRVIGEQTLTFEELSTIFAKIEAIMNSRPLCQLSTDASEIDALTPGHFLVGGPLIALPEYDFTETPSNRLSRWQLLQKCTQQFWKHWSRDYLHTLIQRSKWQQRQENLKIGTVVLIGEDNTAPLSWSKGVIEAVYPGKDKVVRVVTVKTSNGTLKRPASKIYPLPAQ